MQDSTFDVRDFRRALGKFPTGVTVITTKDANGNPIGVTASSFNSVSISPALVLWSVDKGSLSAKVFQEVEHFAVNVLGKSQIDMSNRFAGRGEDKFAGVDFSESPHGSPLFDNCSAQFECKTWSVYEGGDHYIIVGEVLDYRHVEANSPLVFTEGSYSVSMQHPSVASREGTESSADGFLGDYLLYLLRVAYTNYSAFLYPELMETFQITPEEWRVLTLLGDASKVASGEEMAQMVGQPLDNFMATSQIMQEKGLLIETADGPRLTEQGVQLASKVFELAKSHEGTMLQGLSDDERSNMKQGLKLVADAAARSVAP